jgi:hypothetical protein
MFFSCEKFPESRAPDFDGRRSRPRLANYEVSGYRAVAQHGAQRHAGHA